MRQSAFPTTMLLGFLLLGCSLEEEVLVPNFGESEFISQTYPLNQSMKSRLEGVYRVEQGSTRFGKQVVVTIPVMLVVQGNSEQVFLVQPFQASLSATLGLVQLGDSITQRAV